MRHSFTTRLLYTLIPATWYARKKCTIAALNGEMAMDLKVAFERGITIKAAR